MSETAAVRNEVTEEQNTTKNYLNIEDIKALIPHRYPFLLIDRIINIDGDICATGIKNVTINEPYFPGHFPERPIMPGVLIVEAMAQTSGAIVVNSLPIEKRSNIVYFMTIDSAKFRRPVTPGDTLHIKVQKLQSIFDIWKYRGEAFVDNVLVAEAEYKAKVVKNNI